MKNIESYFDLLPYNGNLVRNSNKSGSTQIGPSEYSNPEPEPQEKNWFYVEDVSGENNTLTFTPQYSPQIPPEFADIVITSYDFYVSKDKMEWTKLKVSNTSGKVEYEFGANEKVYVKCDTPLTGFSELWYIEIGCSGNFNVGGNIMSLLYGSDFTGNETELKTISLQGIEIGGFTGLFARASNLMSAENLILPATTLTAMCYTSMFSGCHELTAAPQLPATTLNLYCYQSMFYGCTSLTAAPQLPATTLSEGCYTGMFSGCTSLTAAPQLPATTLASYCYNGMFSGCTSLETAPELPATTLTDHCYSNMFSGCTSLTGTITIKCVSEAEGCYSFMFDGCSSLNSIYISATSGEWDSNNSADWLNGVAQTGMMTASSRIGIDNSGRNASTCPSGWSLEIWK